MGSAAVASIAGDEADVARPKVGADVELGETWKPGMLYAKQVHARADSSDELRSGEEGVGVRETGVGEGAGEGTGEGAGQGAGQGAGDGSFVGQLAQYGSSATGTTNSRAEGTGAAAWFGADQAQQRMQQQLLPMPYQLSPKPQQALNAAHNGTHARRPKSTGRLERDRAMNSSRRQR